MLMLPKKRQQRCQSNAVIMWRCQRNEDNNISATRAMMPAQYRHNAGVIRAKTPVQCQQRHQQNGGKYASATTSCNNDNGPGAMGVLGDKASSTVEKTLVPQGQLMPALHRQLHQCIKGDDASMTRQRNDGKDANVTMAIMPSQQG
jgi:hypothetical protein